MEILILPMLVFIFVLIVIILFNRLSTSKRKADRSWHALQAKLKKQGDLQVIQPGNPLVSGVENARVEYNKIVAQYNKLIQKFPTNFMAAMAGYTSRELYED